MAEETPAGCHPGACHDTQGRGTQPRLSDALKHRTVSPTTRTHVTDMPQTPQAPPLSGTSTQTRNQNSHRRAEMHTGLTQLSVVLKTFLCMQLLKHFGKKITASKYRRKWATLDGASSQDEQGRGLSQDRWPGHQQWGAGGPGSHPTLMMPTLHLPSPTHHCLGQTEALVRPRRRPRPHDSLGEEPAPSLGSPTLVPQSAVACLPGTHLEGTPCPPLPSPVPSPSPAPGTCSSLPDISFLAQLFFRLA